MQPGIFKMVIGIVGIAIAMIMFPIILEGTHDIATDQQIDTSTNVATSGTPSYQGVITLSQDLYNNSVGQVTSITSSSGTDTPVAATYVSASGSLTVTGLLDTGTRTLVTTYDYDAIDTYSGMDSVVHIAPLFVFVGLLFGGSLSAYAGFRQLKGST